LEGEEGVDFWAEVQGLVEADGRLEGLLEPTEE